MVIDFLLCTKLEGPNVWNSWNETTRHIDSFLNQSIELPISFPHTNLHRYSSSSPFLALMPSCAVEGVPRMSPEEVPFMMGWPFNGDRVFFREKGIQRRDFSFRRKEYGRTRAGADQASYSWWGRDGLFTGWWKSSRNACFLCPMLSSMMDFFLYWFLSVIERTLIYILRLLALLWSMVDLRSHRSILGITRVRVR